MDKSAVSFCLIFVLTVAMLMLGGIGCEAADINVQIKLDKTVSPHEVYVNELGQKFAGVCRAYSSTKKQCQGDQFEWSLVVQGGPLDEDEEVMIKNAENHLSCFGTSDPLHLWNHTNQTTNFGSGVPSDVCAQDKFGTYWPYVVEYWKKGALEATTDPGGVIFP